MTEDGFSPGVLRVHDQIRKGETGLMLPDFEPKFREMERRLDDLLRNDRAAIEARGIEIRDNSARRYHYKNELLSWSHWFELRTPRRSEVELVAVWLEFAESELPVIKVSVRAQIFLVGQNSRWSSNRERTLSIEELNRDGLAHVVIQGIEEGQAEARRVV